MKKVYSKPAISVLDIEAESLMAATITTDGNTGSGGIYDDEELNTGGSKGHAFDLWADEED